MRKTTKRNWITIYWRVIIESEFDFVTHYLALQINIIKNNFNVFVLSTFCFFFVGMCIIVSQGEEHEKKAF